ncbi:hypothetical protein H5410_030878 [Solanum commersonii]|uniref:Uncharacterized protein n=1 Tax=Solanum commersonii TaxID=4109 RepID=A0A9J5YK12_SOLCO|nr:hypothetical protein H5410_030878 [Solanum commersonii]
MIEDGMKNERIKSLESLQSTSKALQLVLFDVERKKRKNLLRIPDPLLRSFDPSKTCAYHSGV